jgi:hypothetical protein
VVEDGFPWVRLGQKKKSTPSRNRSSIRRLPKSPTLISKKVKNWPPKHNVNKQDMIPLRRRLHEPQTQRYRTMWHSKT